MNKRPEKASLINVYPTLFLLSFFFLAFGFTTSYAQPAEYKMSRFEYIDKFKDDAIKEMMMHGVPASITLAQGMLESDNGNSALAVYANNHFGIKCHKDWTGPTYVQDDDSRDECFRKYPHVLDSYSDHSAFLRTRSRYNFLFELSTTDYKAWAAGLKEAGYATDPRYAEKLIQIIETNKLYQYDSIGYRSTEKSPGVTHKGIVKAEKSFVVHRNNKRKYIVIKQGDTFYSIAGNFNIELFDLFKYNDCNEKYVVRIGEKIYLEPKRKAAAEAFHIVKQGDTMHAISQQYGIKLKSLYRKNHMKCNSQPAIGDTLWLQKKKPR